MSTRRPGPPDVPSKLRRALGIGGVTLCVLIALGVAALFLALMGPGQAGGLERPECYGARTGTWGVDVGHVDLIGAELADIKRQPVSSADDLHGWLTDRVAQRQLVVHVGIAEQDEMVPRTRPNTQPVTALSPQERRPCGGRSALWLPDNRPRTFPLRGATRR